MKCSSCGNEFGNGANCQNCGVDKVTGLGNYSGFSAPESKDKHPQEPIPQSQMVDNKICPFCQEIIPSYADYCPVCSKKLEETCPKCGHVYSAHFPACPKCGTNREQFLKAKREREEHQRQEEVMKRQQEERLKREKERKEQEENQRKWEQRKLDFEKWSEINNHYLELRKQYGKRWWKTENGANWLRTAEAEFWLKDDMSFWLDDMTLLNSRNITEFDIIDYFYFKRKDEGLACCRWLKERQGRLWLKTTDGRNFVVRNYLFLAHPIVWFDWMKTEQGKKWIESRSWLESRDGIEWQMRIGGDSHDLRFPLVVFIGLIIISILTGLQVSYLIDGLNAWCIYFSALSFLILNTLVYLIRIVIKVIWCLKWRKWLIRPWEQYDVEWWPWYDF